MSRLQIVHSIQRIACTKCGAEANASCNCGATYEVLLAKRENERKASKAYREREKEKQNQSPRHMTHDPVEAAERAEARCAAELQKMSRRRRERIARGEKDKPKRQYTFHDRVVGYA